MLYDQIFSQIKIPHNELDDVYQAPDHFQGSFSSTRLATGQVGSSGRIRIVPDPNGPNSLNN